MRAFPSLSNIFSYLNFKVGRYYFCNLNKMYFFKHTGELYGEEDIGVSRASLPFRDEEVRRPSENSWFIQE